MQGPINPITVNQYAFFNVSNGNYLHPRFVQVQEIIFSEQEEAGAFTFPELEALVSED
jgi:hypothetical protein